MDKLKIILNTGKKQEIIENLWKIEIKINELVKRLEKLENASK